MEDLHARLEAADAVLHRLLRLKVTRLDAGGDLTKPIHLLEGRGINLLRVGPIEDSDGMPTGEELVRAEVDLETVLGEALAPFHVKVTGEVGHGAFLSLALPGLPPFADALFLKDPAQRLFAARGASPKEVVLLAYTGDRQPEIAPLAAIGICPVALRELGAAVSRGSLQSDLSVIRATSRAALKEWGQPEPRQLETLTELAAKADPVHVVEYASTYRSGGGQDRLFEAAAAKVLDRLVGFVVPLGGDLRGAAVPDGLLVQELGSTTGTAVEVAQYDCKSKSEDRYVPKPAEGDQQARYRVIQERLRSDSGWRGRGVIVFAPETDPDDVSAKVESDAWQQLTNVPGNVLRFIPASVLERWWQLAESEPALRLLFRPDLFWRALFDLELVELDEPKHAKVFGDRGLRYRVVSVPDAELMFLAGLASPRPLVQAAATALQAAEPGSRRIASAVARPALLKRYFAALRAPNATLETIATTVGVSIPAAQYLVACRCFDPSHREEWGALGTRNIDRLASELE